MQSPFHGEYQNCKQSPVLVVTVFERENLIKSQRFQYYVLRQAHVTITNSRRKRAETATSPYKKDLVLSFQGLKESPLPFRNVNSKQECLSTTAQKAAFPPCHGLERARQNGDLDELCRDVERKRFSNLTVCLHSIRR